MAITKYLRVRNTNGCDPLHPTNQDYYFPCPSSSTSQQDCYALLIAAGNAPTFVPTPSGTVVTCPTDSDPTPTLTTVNLSCVGNMPSGTNTYIRLVNISNGATFPNPNTVPTGYDLVCGGSIANVAVGTYVVCAYRKNGSNIGQNITVKSGATVVMTNSTNNFVCGSVTVSVTLSPITLSVEFA